MPATPPSDPPPEPEKTAWEWRTDAYTSGGVALEGDRVVYWEQGPRDQGGSSEQSVLEFLAFDAREELPDAVRAELLATIRRRAGDAWPDLERAAAAHRRNAEQERADAARAKDEAQAERIASHAAAKNLKDPWRSYSGTALPGRAGSGNRGATAAAPAVRYGAGPRARGSSSAAGARTAPWLPTVGWSLVLHAALLAAAVPLAYWSPYVAGFFLLFAGVILMIMAPIWFDAWSLSIAAILAAIGAVGAILSLDRARELGAGEIVRDISVAAAPAHPGATGFVFRDARLLAERSAGYRHVVYRTHGSGPAMQVSHYVVAPLVPLSWMPGAAVPAWAACHGTYESDCVRNFARARPAAAVTVRRYERDAYYANAVAAALQRHGLAAAAGAPVVSLVDDPAPGKYYWAAVWWAQPAAFAVWLATFAGWRLWRRFRPASAGA